MPNSSYNSDSDVFLSLSSDDDSFNSVPPPLADSLVSIFSDVSRNFNVVHINAQSVPAHFIDMLTVFNCKDVHAILISESWLKPCLSSSSYELPGFNLIRNDRAVGGGGGVAIYLRNNISFTIVSVSAQPPPPNGGEHLFLEVELHHSKILLGVFYCPSLRINFFSSFEQLLESFVPLYDHTIIMGDFNTCLLKNDFRSASLTQVIESANLSLLNLNATHYFPNSVPSLLDLILVSSPNHIAKHGQCSADHFSYHDLIYVSYKIRPPKHSSKILSLRNFEGMNVERLREDASNIDWTPLLQSLSVDDRVEILTSNIIQLYDKHAPVRAVRVKHLPAPWLNNEIKTLIARKSAAKFRYKIRPNDVNKNKYIAIRNHCNKVCRNAKRQHIHKSLQNSDPAKVWKFLRSLGVGKSAQSSLPKNLNFNSLNCHFSSSPVLDRATKASTLNSLSLLPISTTSRFEFSRFTEGDVRRCILSSASNAVGSDCVSRKMLIPILDQIIPVILFVLNSSISDKTFPKSWKEAHLIPLPKKSNPTSFTDFRPISILPFLSKILEKLVHQQLSIFLSKHNLLSPFQSGFRPGHSTTTALVNITDDIRSGMESGKLTVLALLDFSNAFNTVDFDLLLGVLGSFGMSPSVIDWFRSYLFGRRQRVHFDDSKSSWCSTAAGVPQGGVLSPLLFTLFINSISQGLSSSYHLYADDLQIYTQACLEDLPAAISLINVDMARIGDWSSRFGLLVNPTKTQVTIIGSARTVSKINWASLPQVSFLSSNIPFSRDVKNLGIYIDSNLSWNKQLQEVSRKLFASAGSLRRLRNFLPTNTKIALAQSLLLPILDYADVSYLDLTQEQLDKLERLQNLSIRFIFGLRKYDHVSEFRNKLKWLPIRLRRNAHILSLLFNVLFNPAAPSYLKERFQFLGVTHTKFLRSSENLKLSIRKHSTCFYDKSFTIQAARLWNALPVEARRAKTPGQFKRLVKEHYLSL